MQRKKARCPAVTLEVIANGKTISIDFVLGLKVHRASWPDFTKDGFKIENWLGKKEKDDMKRRQPFYLVPKYVGKGDAEHEGVVAKGILCLLLSVIFFVFYMYMRYTSAALQIKTNIYTIIYLKNVLYADSWRISFSHVEKEILKRHGHSKTCCEAAGKKCCR